MTQPRGAEFVFKPEDFILRPVPAFRVGITGARTLNAGPNALEALRQSLAAVLARVKAVVEDQMTDPYAAGIYAPGAPLLRMLSPLAEGADRLAAQAALALGYQLEVLLPFEPGEYEKDFPGSVDEFRALLAQAGAFVLVLDGGRGAGEARSYEATGRAIARNCDLLISIWDGGRGQGRGGTSEITRYAARHGLPVWWLRADGTGDPSWIERQQDIRYLDKISTGEAAWNKLETYVRAEILPPPVQPDKKNPLAIFLAETPQAAKPIWETYQRVMRLAAGPAPAGMRPQSSVPPGIPWSYWQAYFMPPDRLAVDYGNRYRSSYILIFALATLALSFAASGFGFREEALIATILEFFCLAGILWIVRLNLSQRWHERLIAYRLLAELFRKQQGLAMFGWSLPVRATLYSSEEAASKSTDLPRDLWVGWYFNAVLRAAPLPQGRQAGAPLEISYVAVHASLITGQADYHARRQWDCETSARRLGELGRAFFMATLLMVLLKMLLLIFQIGDAGYDADMAPVATNALRLLLGLLPSISAALVGIRNYAELQVMADQSAWMLRLMARAETTLQSLNLREPLASQDLGAELSLLAEDMLLDNKGWAQLTRVRTVEPW